MSEYPVRLLLEKHHRDIDDGIRLPREAALRHGRHELPSREGLSRHQRLSLASAAKEDHAIDVVFTLATKKLRATKGLEDFPAMATQTYSMETLSAETGIAARTLRSWIGRKVLPKPVGRSRAARYDEGHALRARVIDHLRSKGDSLRTIRTRIAPLSPSELAALLPRKRIVDEHGVPPPPPVTSYPFTMWEMVQLMPGMALMVSPNGGPALKRIADEIYRHYSMTPPRDAP